MYMYKWVGENDHRIIHDHYEIFHKRMMLDQMIVPVTSWSQVEYMYLSDWNGFSDNVIFTKVVLLFIPKWPELFIGT